MQTTSHASRKPGRAAARVFQSHPGDHRFFTVMSVVTALAIGGGFLNSYGPKVVTGAPGVPSIIHLHAVVFGAWLVLFVVQTTLVGRGRTGLHRQLGVAAVLGAGLMFVVGAAAAVQVARLGHRGIPGVEFPDVEGFLLLNLATVAVFTILVAAGWYHRRNVQAHKRLMLMATAGTLVGPGVSRLPLVAGHAPVIGLLVLAFMFAGPVYDVISRRRVHPAYVWSLLLALSAIPPVVTPLSATAAWRAIAGWLLS